MTGLMADTTILSWITAEVDQALERVRRQLAAYRTAPGDAAPLAACPEHLHQVSGALNMVGLSGATRFCEALERSLTGLEDAGAQGAAVLDRAVLELRQFVDDVARGQPNAPTRLFPVYRELAQLQGREDSSEIELFFPDLTPPAPSHPRPLAIEAAELPAFLQSQRTRWQRAILGWIRREPQALDEMRATLDVIHSVAHLLPERRALWWVAGALADGLPNATDPQRLAQARSLWNKIDIYIRQLAQGRDASPDNEPLLRDLLYAIACCAPLTQRLRDVKRLYGLDALLPAQGARSPDVDTLQPVLEDVRLRLQAAQQTWQQYLEGEPSGALAFRARVQALKERVGALSSAPLSALLRAVGEAAATLPDPRPPDSEAMLAEMASAFLLAESILETFLHPAPDLDEQVSLLGRWLADAAGAGKTVAPPAGLRRELTEYVSSLQLRSQVAKEMLANLQRIEQVLDGYARGQKELAELRGVAPQLRQIHGALSVLGWDRAIAALERCEALMPTLSPGSASLDWVAEGLSALELFISPCVNGREPRQAALDLFLARAAQQPMPEKAGAQSAGAPSDELLQVFLEEAADVVAAVEAGLAACRAEPEKLEALAAIRRGFHTLKGSGRMVGLTELGEAAWEVERAMNQWLEQKQPASAELLELVALAHQRFSAWIAQLRAGESPLVDPAPLRRLAAGLRAQDDPAVRMREIYFKEAAAHAATLKAQYGAWREQAPAEASPEFMRAAHTLASSSRTAGFPDIATLAAALEQWLALAARTGEPGDAAVVGECVDTLAAMVEAAGRGEARRGGEDALAALRALKDRLQVPARRKDKRTVRDDIDAHLLPVFLDEARELLPQLGRDLRDWQASPEDRHAADAVKRALHTLKGSARMAGAIRLGELTHLMESRIEFALEAGELTTELFEDLEGKMDRLSADLEKLGAPGAAAAPAAASTPMLRINAERLDRLITEAGEAAIARSRIEAELRQVKQALGELSESVSRLRTQLREVEIQADSQMQSRRAVLEEREGEFDPLEFDRYTRLQELTRMMAEGLSDAASLQQALLHSVGETDAALLQQARISRELQQDLMRMRAVPFSSLSERLHRVVRQAARELGKKAELAIDGGQVELDRGVLERMAAPLEHMLRNAMVHGIEAPETRVAAGKPESGRISIALRQEANQLVIALADDGIGIDGARLRERAAAKGLIPAEQPLSPEECVQLVFLSGLSTAEAVSELAGRGIGLDVVRSEVNAIGGRVEADAAAGRGTHFTIYLPLTLAVTQALMVRAGTQRFAIASAAVEQVLRVKADELVACYEAAKVVFRESDYPLHYLHQLFGSRGATHIADYNAVLLVRSGTQRVALHVDELVGSREMVVKNIGPQLARIPGVAGATVMPDGSIVLIVNPIQLVGRAALPVARTGVPELAAREVRAPLVMVVDDSITVRKVTGRLLEREGYRVLTAKDGVDALEQLKGELPAVLLVDIEMPRMDGFDLARNVRGDPRTTDIPIIVISSRTAAKHRSRAAQLGVDVFLGKPYEEAELVRHVAAFAAR
ncbi:MAG TPA: Hpt domain-containing protein [Burkholderiales bacterium]|nr:Hpt domain-containing protein [Burkholderiales bacterium]